MLDALITGNKIDANDLTKLDYIHMLIFAVDEYRKGNKVLLEQMAAIMKISADGSGIKF